MQNYKTVRELNDMIVVRLTTLARTSSLPLLCRRWMRDQSMGMLASPLVTQEREVRHHSEFITLIEKSSVTRSSHVGTSTERLVAMWTEMSCRSFLYSEREWILCEREEIRDFLELRVAHAARGEKSLYQGTLKRNIIRDYLLSEARSELEMQQLRVADRALQESGLQHHSQRMVLYTRRINDLIIPRERSIGFQQNWTGEKRFFKRIV